MIDYLLMILCRMMLKFKKYILETIKYLLRCSWVIRPYIKRVERLYAMSNDELRSRNEKRFLEIFRRAYQYSPFYRKLYMDAGIQSEDIQGLGDIKKLPIITKDMVKKHAEEMLIQPKWKMVKANTSGTTGTPLRVYESWSSIWWEQAYLYCSRKRNGFVYGQPLVSLRGNLDRSISHLKVHVSNTLFLSSYNINKNTIEEYHKRIVHHSPTAIEGYPSSLYTFALCLKEAGLELHIPVAFTSSETLLDYQRSLIEKQLNTEIFDNYGMTERTINLLETRNHAGYYEAPGYSINEYVEDGEICTSLINHDFPMIRYRSYDVMQMKEPGIVTQILGRMDDEVICKDGTKVSRIDFIENGNNIKACQWVQYEVGHLLVNVVPDVGFSETDKEFIRRETLKRTGADNMDIEIRVVNIDQLVYSSRGKFQLIVNKRS